VGGKGGSVTSTAQIPAELKPLYEGAVKDINSYSQQNPLSQFGAPQPEGVQGLSYTQRLGLGNVPELFNASPLEALSLQAMLQEPALAGATSTSGTPNLSGQPGLGALFNALGGVGAGPSTYVNPNQPAIPAAAGTTPATGPGPGQGGGPGGPGAGGGPGTTPNQTAGMHFAGANAFDPGSLGPGAVTPPRPPVNPPGSGKPPTTTVPFPPPNTTGGTGPPSGGGPGPGVAEPLPAAPDLSALLNVGAQPQYTGGFTVENSPGVKAGYKAVTGNEIINDPAVAAALKAFSDTVKPGILNQSGLMGLGRSDSANRAVTSAQGQILAPLYIDSFNRAQAVNDRGYGATETELARRDAALQRVAAAKTNQANQLSGLASQRYNEMTGAVGTALQAGGAEQETGQKGLTSIFNDYLRRQGLAEQSRYAPFGSTVGGTIGSKSVSSGK
jgi:hypothetical protein